MQAPDIRPIVRLRVSALAQTGTDAGGFPIYGTTFQTYDFNVADSLLGRISYGMQKPRFAGDEQFDGLPIDLTLELVNPDGYLATFQNGYGLRAQDIEQGEVRIYANIGVGNPIEMFQGRIYGRPSETKGRTVIKARGSLWDAIRKPVTYESFAGMTAYSDGLTFTTQSAHLTAVGGDFCVFHGLVTWDSNGRPQPAFRQESGTMSLSSVIVNTGAKLGVYRIEFRDTTNFTITYPDNQTYTGSINLNLLSPAIVIETTAWIGTDGTDTVIEFEIGVSYKGNPVAIAYNLLEKGLLGNWGALPQLNPAVRIDWPTFETLAQRFKTFVVFVDATNKDNKVWEKRGADQPLDTATLAQWVLKHVSCTLTLTSDGLITLISPYIDDMDVWPLQTKSDILVDGISIEGIGEAVNYLTLQFGHDSRSNTFGGSIVEDMRMNATASIVETNANAHFYKFPQSYQEALWLAETFKRRHFFGRTAQTIISFNVTPQMGLTLLPGDIVRVVSQERPFVSAICEIINVDMEIGGAVGIKAATIQQTPEGQRAEVCTAQYNAVTLW